MVLFCFGFGFGLWSGLVLFLSLFNGNNAANNTNSNSYKSDINTSYNTSSEEKKTKGLSEESIIFLNKEFNLSTWTKLQGIIDCMSVSGRWILQPSLNIFNSSFSYAENFDRISPCFNTRFYSSKNFCYHNIDSSNYLYHWKVNKMQCQGYQMKRFILHKFLHLINGNVFFVGDSMTSQMYDTIQNMALISSYGVDGIHYFDNCTNKCIVFKTMECDAFHLRDFLLPNPLPSQLHRVPHNRSQVESRHLYFARNDILSLTDESNKVTHPKFGGFFYETDWKRVLKEKNITLLILNRGAHLSDDDSLIADVNATLYYLTNHHPGISIVWRNTPFGVHDERNKFRNDPLTDPPTTAPKIYGYENFERQNNLVNDLLKSKYPAILRLNVFTSTIMRQDLHSDNLHFCIPGPLDNWVTLLYNALMIVRAGSPDEDYDNSMNP